MRKVLRGAPDSFASFEAGQGTRTPLALVRHMNDVLNHARSFFGGPPRLGPPLSFEREIARFFEILSELGGHLDGDTPLGRSTPERLLQGPLSDAMTHVGQLSMLRRLAGMPIPPENFHNAVVDADDVGLE